MRVDGGKSTVGPRHKSETAEEKKRREQLSLRKAKKRRKDREEKELARIKMAEEKEEEDDEDYGLNNESAGIKKTTKTHRKGHSSQLIRRTIRRTPTNWCSRNVNIKNTGLQGTKNTRPTQMNLHRLLLITITITNTSHRSANQAMTNKVGIPWIRRHTIATNTMEVKKRRRKPPR